MLFFLLSISSLDCGICIFTAPHLVATPDRATVFRNTKATDVKKVWSLATTQASSTFECPRSNHPEGRFAFFGAQIRSSAAHVPSSEHSLVNGIVTRSRVARKSPTISRSSETPAESDAASDPSADFPFPVSVSRSRESQTEMTRSNRKSLGPLLGDSFPCLLFKQREQNYA